MADTPSGSGPSAAGAAQAPGSTPLESDLATLKSDVSKLTDTIATLVSDGAATARSAAREGVDRATYAAESARDRARGAADELSTTVERNPLTSVLVALGAGYLIGVLGRSRG